MTDRDEIIIPPIALEWSEWTPWSLLLVDARSPGQGIRVPNKQPGVYEAKYIDPEERLTIGKTGDLRFRIKQCLVKGKSGHPAGDDVRANEDVSRVVVRWAVTNRPSAAEEELHRRHQAKFGALPKYTDYT